MRCGCCYKEGKKHRQWVSDFDQAAEDALDHDFAGGCKISSAHVQSLLQHLCDAHGTSEGLSDEWQEKLWADFKSQTWDEEFTAVWQEGDEAPGIKAAEGQEFHSSIGRVLRAPASGSSGNRERERRGRSRDRKKPTKRSRSRKRKAHASQKKRKRSRSPSESRTRSRERTKATGFGKPEPLGRFGDGWPDSVQQYFDAYCELPGAGQEEKVATLTKHFKRAVKEAEEALEAVGRLKLAVGPALCWPWRLALGARSEAISRSEPKAKAKAKRHARKPQQHRPGARRSAVRQKLDGSLADFGNHTEEAINIAEDKELTKGSRATTKSRLRTWDAIAEEVFGKSIAARPARHGILSGPIVKAVMAFFVRNGYRTAVQYLSDAMQRHKKTDNVDARLRRQVKASERAALRNLGPADRKDPLNFPAAVSQSDHPRLTAAATWYLMREAEIEAANIEDVIVSVGKRGLSFPRRKADQSIGFRAFRDCICDPCKGGKPERAPWCPSCVLAAQALERKQALLSSGMDEKDWGPEPLFLGATGLRITRDEVVQGIEKIARLQKIPLTKGNVRRRFGGHTYRISGAVMAYHAGAEDQEVCDLGGWSSVETMKKYLRGVPFTKTATITNRLADIIDAGSSEPTARQAALVEDLPRKAAGETLVRNGLTAVLHKPGRRGHLACGDQVTEHHVNVLANPTRAEGESFCSKPGCWPAKRTLQPAAPGRSPKLKPKAGPKKNSLPKKLKKMVGLAR